MTSPRPPVRGPTRRRFLAGLGWVGATAALGAVAGVRCAPRASDTAPGERFFTGWETEILTQVAERMVETGEPDAPRLRDTHALEVIDRVVRGLDPAVSGQLPLAIRLFEYGPLLFDATPSRFSRLDDAGKDASIEAWRRSRLALRRQGFLAFRNLALLGYYSQDATWGLIGYRGPLIGGTRS